MVASPLEGGLIPAHAGKTPDRNRPARHNRAHPRSRGENVREVAALATASGSSPLTRGKLGAGGGDRSTVGLIPAHAGKTRPPPGPSRWGPAHPRSRGENRGLIQRRGEPQGSSPLTRGKQRSWAGRACRLRLIPAHAGKTRNARILGNKLGAHPRSRGENRRPRRGSLGRGGSSPLTRGKPPPTGSRTSPMGLIPAHAGKTSPSRQWRNRAWAHPRSRGENLASYAATIAAMGSSPLTRGKPPESAEVHTWIRLIPAHAGKTRPSRMPVMEVRAHPRSRGENQDRASVF